MTVLLFNDRGWEITTSAWSAASKDGRIKPTAHESLNCRFGNPFRRIASHYRTAFRV
jgi:hypothetical protein